MIAGMTQEKLGNSAVSPTGYTPAARKTNGVPFGSGQPVPRSPGRPRKTKVERVADKVIAKVGAEVAANFEKRLEALLPLAEARLLDILSHGTSAKPADQIAAINLVLTRTRGLPVTRNLNVNLDGSDAGVRHLGADEIRAAARKVLGAA